MPKVEPPNKTLDSTSQEAHSQEVQTTTESPKPEPSKEAEAPRLQLDEEGHAKMDLDGPIATKMREIDAEAQRLIDYSDKLQPRGGEVAVGKEGVHEGFTGWAIRTLLREVGRGKTVDEAQQIATDELLEANKKQNSRNPDYVTQRWERNGVDKIEHAAKRLRETIQTPEAPKAEKPPDAPQAQALARTTPARGTPERNKLEEEYGSSSKAWEDYYDKERQLRQDADNAKHGTKKKEAAVAKYNKYRDNQPQSNEALRKQSYRASLEDAVEQTENPVLQIAAKNKISDMAEEERRSKSNVPLSQDQYADIQKAREKASRDIQAELAKRIPDVEKKGTYSSTADEIKALSDKENDTVRAQVAKDMAQRFIESPLTAEGIDKHLEGALHGGRVRAYKTKAKAIMDAEEERYHKIRKGGGWAGGNVTRRVADEAYGRIDGAYEIGDIDRSITEGKEAIAKAIEHEQQVNKDTAEAKVNLSKRVRPLSEMASPRMNDSDGPQKVWNGNVAEGGTLLSDGHSAIDSTAILDKKRAASLRNKGDNTRSIQESVVRSGAWDKITGAAKQPLEEIGTFPGIDIGTGNPDTAVYALPDGTAIVFSAKKVRFIQSLTGATEVRGSTPKHGAAFYRNGKPVAVLMPLGASPDIDIDVARKAAVTSGPPKVKPDEPPEKTPEP